MALLEVDVLLNQPMERQLLPSWPTSLGNGTALLEVDVLLDQPLADLDGVDPTENETARREWNSASSSAENAAAGVVSTSFSPSSSSGKSSGNVSIHDVLSGLLGSPPVLLERGR